jgi:hypothetical protein
MLEYQGRILSVPDYPWGEFNITFISLEGAIRAGEEEAVPTFHFIFHGLKSSGNVGSENCPGISEIGSDRKY